MLDGRRVYFRPGFEDAVCLGGRVRSQEPKVADPIASTDRKQREMDAGAQLTVSFLFRPALRLVLLTFRVDLPTSIKQV